MIEIVGLGSLVNGFIKKKLIEKSLIFFLPPRSSPRSPPRAAPSPIPAPPSGSVAAASLLLLHFQSVSGGLELGIAGKLRSPNFSWEMHVFGIELGAMHNGIV